MRHLRILIGLGFYLAACTATTPTPPPMPVSSLPSSPTTTEPLAVRVTPDFDVSFKPVAGRAPFTVAVGANISGGTAPYQVAWDITGAGKIDSSGQKPRPFVFDKPGTYDVTVQVKDYAGQWAGATRRIVVFSSPPLPAWQYGVSAHFERRRAGYYPTLDDVKRACALARAAGIQVVRIDFNWDQLNPESGRWNFDDYDAMVRIVRACKLDILAIIDYASWWASSAQASDDWRVRLFSEPRSNYEFARYAYELVSHFKTDVHAWEIWNEENTRGFWKPAPNAVHYVQLLQEAYLAIKYADPGAVVVFGGLSGNGVEGQDEAGTPSNFIAQAYAAGAQNYFDVMAIHPYVLPNSGIATVAAKIATTRAVMNQRGDIQVPLWLTEIGAPDDVAWWTNASIESQTDVALWLGQVYTRLWGETTTIFWYDLQDQGVGDTVEQHFGLLRLDFSAKTAYDKLRSLTLDR